MSYKFKVLIGIIIGIFIGLIIYLSQIPEKPFSKIILENNNHITNSTNMLFLDTVLQVGLNELHIKDTYIVLMPLIASVNVNSKESIDVAAYIKTESFKYVIVISKVNRQKSIEILSHELIHLNQYYTKRLIINKDTAYWLGTKLIISDLVYENYPWEIEAFKLQYDLKDKIKNELYKN